MNRAFYLGLVSGKNNLALNKCPYSPEETKYKEWRRGFARGKKEINATIKKIEAKANEQETSDN